MSSKTISKSELEELLDTARAHFRESRYQLVQPLLEQIMFYDQRIPEVYNMLATIYYDQGKFNKAIKTFKRALEIEPAYTDAAVGLSIILNDLGRYQEGQQVFTDAQDILKRKNFERDPYHNEKLVQKHEELADLYMKSSQFEYAKEFYEKALEIGGQRLERRMKWVDCMLKLDPQMGLQELKKMVNEHPRYNAARIKLGLLFYNSGRAPEAIEQWESVLIRDPDHQLAKKYIQMAMNSNSALL